MDFGILKQLVLTLVLVAAAEFAESSWDLAALMNERAAVIDERATFQETRILQMMRKPLEVSGELFYRAPDYLRKTVLRPEYNEMEVVGQRLLLADSESRQRFHVNQHPALAGMVAAIRGALAGDLTSLEVHFVPSFEGTEGAWRLDLTPRSPDVAEHIESIIIEGDGRRLMRMETRYPSGDLSLMRMQPIE